MKKFCRCIILLVLLGCGASNAIAQISYKHVVVQGIGVTQPKAIEDALMEAIFQIYGVKIAAETRASMFSAYTDDVEIFSNEIHRVMSRQSLSGKKNELLGYKVVSSGQDSDSLNAVTLRTKYSEYRVPGPKNKRRSLAVLNFPVVGGGYLSAGATEISSILTSRIEALLTQSRQFSVLDRARGDIYDLEKQLLESEDVNVAERARLGKVAGADYIVYGKILPVSVEKVDKSISISGEYRVQTVAKVPIEFRVLAVATRQLKWSSTITAESVIEHTEPNQAIDKDQAINTALAEVAELVFTELTENIYPAKISKVLTGNRFILNRGGNTVENGMLFEVFSVGENIIDPYTSESLGAIESLVGLAKIVEKKPKYSIAEFATSTLIKEGMILRKYRGKDGMFKQKIATKPSYEDADNDALPDYLQLLNSSNSQ